MIYANRKLVLDLLVSVANSSETDVSLGAFLDVECVRSGLLSV